MSAFVVSNIASNLNMLSGEQRFIFGNNTLPEPLGSFKFDNLFTPVIGAPSVTNFETRNKDLSGFRWIHTTNTGDTFGAYKLQSFINAQTTGTDILLFNQDGTITFTSPITFPGFAISGDFDMNNYKIINLANPVDPNDGVNKAYADSLVGTGTVTLSGAISGSGNVGTNIVTTFNTVPINKLAGYPNDNALFLRGDETWANNIPALGINTTADSTNTIRFANGSSDVKIIFNKDTPSNSYDLSGIGFYPTFGTLYHTPIGKSHAFFTGANGNMALEITPICLKVKYGISTVDFRKIVFYEGIVDSNPNQTYAIGVELDGEPTNYIHLRNQVQTINDAFNWCYGIDDNTSSEWMRLNNSGLNLYNKKIFNVLDPQNPQEVATKNYVDNAIDSSFGPVVSLPYDELSFNWAYASSTNPSPYQFTNSLTDSQESKDFKYRVVSGSREWNQEYTLIGNSDLNGIYNINYKVPSLSFTPISITIYPFATSQNLMNITVPIDMGGFEIRNALNPTSSQSLTTKAYVDNLAANLPAIVNVTGGTQTFQFNAVTAKFILSNTISSSVNEYQVNFGGSIGGLRIGVSGDSPSNQFSYINTSGNLPIQFQSDGVTRMYMNGGGSFVVGTSPVSFPYARFDIFGGSQNIFNEESIIRVNSSTGSAKIEINNTSASGHLYELRSNSNSTFDIVDRTSGLVRLIINENGTLISRNKVEIATSVGSANRKIVLFDFSNNDHEFFGFGTNPTVLRYQIPVTGSYHVWYAGTSSTTSNQLMILGGNGNLGLGPVFPPVLAKLQISGGVQNIAGEETAIRAIGDLSNIKIELQNTDASGKIYEIRSSSTGQFDITDRTAAITRYTIDTNGNHIFSNTIYSRRVSGTMSMQNNAVGTTVTTANTFVKVAGTTTNSNLNGLTSPLANRLTVTSTISHIALINVSFTASHNGGGGEETTFALYKNGLQLANTLISSQQLNNLQVLTINTTVPMTTNDTIELWCTSPNNGRIITVKRLLFTYTTT